MLRPRIIPVLLLRDGGLVKTRLFGAHDYIGDPINTVRVFNEKTVDEIVFLDIDASVQGREPNYKLIAKIASEARMPLCYGGGVRTLAQASKIVSLGVEKIALSSGLFSDDKLVAQVSEHLGSQSVVAVLDIKKRFGKYSIVHHNGTIPLKGWKLNSAIEWLQDQGIGELVVNCIDSDGLMQGYDLDLISRIKPHVHVPLTVVGGAGTFEHMENLVKRFGLIGAGAGSYFVFKGIYKAVLISYPDLGQKERLRALAYPEKSVSP